MAREYRIHGFAIIITGFGKRLPFDDTLQWSARFSICLCWANENWTRIWDGGDSEVLMEQTYSEQDDLAHSRWLSHAFADPRYIRVDNRPLFIIYRAH